ncbi:pilus (MSHA type) biogenesis protein MshL [Campylobacter sp. JMF_01 NE2]|uniref:pilus (MSHA type) biogenesis protein MshL n=1 Tax=unclassified Campylobacter TaxID=2593542 RepID=UPI0022E9D5F2|nr:MULTISPECIES: pilus (MSHA type) biogenesis protein MshL [unclassified Campylobacter]MDA3052475.1 pilus (MSHA type) biogenesis protein MshL [Campylobacter sp. JMF_03 NE3]MDA3066808.1 pilus (MSHA type) biogenesis protein MshL [Campylobacter sp. JMF_01 NE2]
MSLLHTSKKLSLAAMLALSLGVTGLSAASNCDRKALNIKVNDVVTLNEMLTQLSDMCRFSVVAKDAMAQEELAKELQGVSIKDMSLREVFDLLIKENNLSYDYSNNVLKISALETRTFKVDYITSVREGVATTKASVDSSPIEVGDDIDDAKLDDNKITSTEKFDFWEKISDDITSILNNGTEKYVAVAPIINQNAGLITVTATKSQIARVDSYLKSMQKRLGRQVLLDVNIISVELHNEYTTGIDWSKFQLGFNTYIDNAGTASLFNFGNSVGRTITNGTGGNAALNVGTTTGGTTNQWSGKTSTSNGAWAIGANLNFSIDGMINFLETKGKTKVVSSPKVTTMNNQPAIISVGDTINYLLLESATSLTAASDGSSVTSDQTQYSIFIGILLNILPEISDDNRIMLRINPSLSSFKYAEDDVKTSTPRNIAPDTLQKKLSSVVWVDDGDTVILGGLIGQTKSKNNTRVPILAEIPLVGNLFKSTADVLSTTELIFVVTPHIIDNTGAPLATSLKELGYSKSIYEK